MGKKSWVSAVRKVISTSYLKEKKHKKSHNKSKSTKKSFHGNQMSLDRSLSLTKAPIVSPPIYNPPIDEPELKQPEHEPMDQDSSPLIKSQEDIAAIKIQKAYRGYLVRNGSNPLKAWRRLKMYMYSQAVKRQGASTLKSVQTMARVQSQVRTRKIRIAEVNEALREQLHQKRINKLNNSKSSEKSGWDLSPKSKEQVEESLRRKKEAVERREKVLAYSHTHQQTWRKNLKKTKGADWEWNRSASRQSPPFKVVAQPARSQSKVAVLSTKSVKAWSPMSKPGPTPMVSGKKRVQNTGALVGSAKKRVAVSGSPSSVGKKSLGRTNTNTKR
ncbi:hypothetical protein Lser_V15G44325 [Lactuca serriola]